MKVTTETIETDPMDNCHLCKNSGSCLLKNKIRSMVGLKIIIIECPEFLNGK